MGCDIHIVLEKRREKYGWIGVDRFNSFDPVGGDPTKRNYRLFAALAGVRGEGPEPKGLPDDISPLTADLVATWGCDGHSHSWLPLAEAVVEFNKRRYPEGEVPFDPESYRDRCPSSYWFGVDETEVGNHRIVFWFDN